MIEQDTVNTEQAKHDKPTGSTSVTGDRLAEAKRSRGADGLAGGHLAFGNHWRIGDPDTPYRTAAANNNKRGRHGGRAESACARERRRASLTSGPPALEPRRCACWPRGSWPDQFTIRSSHFWIGYCATYTQTTYTRRLRLRPHFNTLHPRWPREDTRQICLMSSAPRRGSRSQAEARAAAGPGRSGDRRPYRLDVVRLRLTVRRCRTVWPRLQSPHCI